jgi:NAD(P)-dependent dehydrogenase (short-subunit alcohol dehydrogenase family)
MSTPQLFDLSGRGAIVTGGGTGLGRAMAEALLEAGGRVVITSRHADKLNAAVSDLSGLGDVHGVACDVRDEGSVEAMFDEATRLLGDVDVLVANAGAAWVEAAATTGRAAWTKVLETNLVGAFQCARRFGADAIEKGRPGSIVFISSIAGQRASGVLPTSAYAASKAGLAGLTRQLAIEWGRHDITVNALAPGYFVGGMSDRALENHRTELLERIPLGRFGGPDDLKGAIVFLASPAARYLTGQVIAIDGGQSAW